MTALEEGHCRTSQEETRVFFAPLIEFRISKAGLVCEGKSKGVWDKAAVWIG